MARYVPVDDREDVDDGRDLPGDGRNEKRRGAAGKTQKDLYFTVLCSVDFGIHAADARGAPSPLASCARSGSQLREVLQGARARRLGGGGRLRRSDEERRLPRDLP